MGEQTYYRLDLAKEQLDIALDLFLDQKRFSAAITLAGAAEEIFGRALKLKGITPAIEKSYESMARFHDDLYGEKLDKTQYIDKENLADSTITTDMAAALVEIQHAMNRSYARLVHL